MDDLQNQTPVPASTPTELEELRSQYESLRSVVAWMLLVLVFISGTLNLYFYRQLRTTQAELQTNGPRIREAYEAYMKNEGPLINNFLQKMADYGRTHPEFVPILTRHGLGIAPATSAPGPGATPMPPAGPAAAPKKK